MSNLFTCVPTMPGATSNEQRDFFRSPFSLSRGTLCGCPVIGAPAFYASSVARPALQSLALYLSIILIATMTMVHSVQADGIVSAGSYTWAGYSSCQALCVADANNPGWYSLSVQSCVNVVQSGASCIYEIKTSNPVATYSRSYTGVPVCPVNSTKIGSTCTCNTGYLPNPTATSCMPEQYTISLFGLGGEVMPTRTRNAYAEVITSTGTPKSGAQVALILTVVPENGEPIRAEYVGSISPNGGATGADGRLTFEFRAPTAGGTHTITATCTNCTNNPVTGTIRVPGCPIPPLTSPPFTDPVAAGFENGNRWRPDLLSSTTQNNYQTKLACVEDAIDAATGVPQSYTGTSAYRPYEYQRHLYEIVDKDKALSQPGYMTAHPECQALMDTITQEMGGHGLKRKQDVAVPGTSRHESGTAFDLTPHGLTKAQMIPIYAGCGVKNTKVKKEPWHVQ